VFRIGAINAGLACACDGGLRWGDLAPLFPLTPRVWAAFAPLPGSLSQATLPAASCWPTGQAAGNKTAPTGQTATSFRQSLRDSLPSVPIKGIPLSHIDNDKAEQLACRHPASKLGGACGRAAMELVGCSCSPLRHNHGVARKAIGSYRWAAWRCCSTLAQQ
jgi:hypothetical protein